jgi:UDP-glucose 4-epimerase
MKESEIKSVLIIGMAGGLAKITAGLLTKKYPNIKITGVDSRPVNHLLRANNIEIKQMKYTRGNFEKLFRNNDFDVIYHLGRVSHAHSNPKSQLAQRLDLNIMGTSRILDLSIKFGIKRVVILSTYHVYGALSDNPVFIKEDAPLRASIKYPELRDVTEMDQLATNWMWKNQNEIETIVLRPCNIIGPQISNSITQYLNAKISPMPVDFNPMFQFIHEFDMANILMHSLAAIPTGIYNVAPEECISIREAKKVIGNKTIPAPITALEPMAKMFKTLWNFPDYLLDYIKFACIIDGSELRKHLPKDIARFNTKEALELLKLD